MEPVSLITGILIGVVLTLAVLVVLGLRRKRKVEKMLTMVFGDDGQGLPDLSAIFGQIPPDAQPRNIRGLNGK